MAVIDPIYNGETGPSVRDKLNELIDTVNSGSQTINVGDAPLYDPDKAGGYEAGSIVSYKNEASPDVEFQEFAIYLALTDIPQGVGPEDSTDWKNEGGTVEVAGGNTANGVVQNITRLRELTGMRTGHTVAVHAERAIYVFDEGSESGIKPFAPGIGSWEKRYEFSEMGGGHIFEDSTGTALPTRNVAKAGAGIEFEDDAVNEMTMVKTTNAAALPNIESTSGATQPTINSLIDARLFEQIAFTLSGYDEDVTTSSQDVLKSLPYNFKAYDIRAEFATAPTGSSAIITFYKNGVSIGTVTVNDSAFSGDAVLAPAVSFVKGDSLSAVVTQVGLTIPGATAKAYVQGIKHQ